MSEAKVEIKIGEIQFSGEGEQDWVAEQLDKILVKAKDLIVLSPVTAASDESEDPTHKPMGNDSAIASKTLPSFLDEKGATKIQTKKFLATAVWLEAKGYNRISTSKVSNALKDSNQKKINNPSDCLNQNVGKGYCEKDGKEFFVTKEGKNSL
jgi:hypothetical protein